MSTTLRPASNGHSRRGRTNGHNGTAPQVPALADPAVDSPEPEMIAPAPENDQLKAQLDRLAAVVVAAADGDLTQEVPFRGDPALGHLADALARLFSELRTSIAGIA